MFAMLVLASAAGAATSPVPSASPSPAPSPAASPAPDDEPPKPVTSEHTVTIGGTAVRYQATAGYIQLKDFSEKKGKEEGEGGEEKGEKKAEKQKSPKPLAKVFYIAYTRQGLPADQKRPLTFCFNGGPGSSSVWLHMGALGPRRVALTDNGEALPPPARFEDNANSWLDGTDLVFVDPVSTGYSRSEKGEDPKQFHGYDEDIESVGEFIRLYTSKNKRWSSPKFLVGESYGTTRAAGLSNHLQRRYGMYLNGIVLVSSVLDFGTLEFAPGNDTPYPLYLPTYAATAWYHQRLAPELQRLSLDELLAQVEDFASHEYRQALFDGGRMDQARRRAVAEKVARFTGLSADWIMQLDHRLPDELFFSHLLMDRNRVIGRYDSRYSAVRDHPGRDDFDFDPSFEAVNGPFSGAVNDYFQRELGFESELPYETLANVWPWKMKRAENRYLNTATELREALLRNPYLKVWICCGHYDLATPYYAARYTVDQMVLDPAVRSNIRFTYYEAGHMLYVLKPALTKMKTDFDAFLKDAIQPDSAAVPAAAR